MKQNTDTMTAAADYLIGMLAAFLLAGVLAAFVLGGAIGGVTATCLVLVGWVVSRMLRTGGER